MPLTAVRAGASWVFLGEVLQIKVARHDSSLLILASQASTASPQQQPLGLILKAGTDSGTCGCSYPQLLQSAVHPNSREFCLLELNPLLSRGRFPSTLSAAWSACRVSMVTE
ncbi:unnamed protein product [Calypogeia fissa]